MKLLDTELYSKYGIHRARIVGLHGLGDAVDAGQDIGNKELGRLDFVEVEPRIAVLLQELPLPLISLHAGFSEQML